MTTLRSTGTLLRDGWHDLVHPAKGNIPALDGARSLAVLLVVASHVGAAWEQASLPGIWALKLPIFYFGWSGVDLFFVLSGLLIGGQLWRELDRTDTVNYWRFFQRRGLRIWPLYFFHLAFLWLFAEYYRPTWPDWLLLSNYWGSGYTRGWSLSTEEHFYLIAPLLSLLLFRFWRRWAGLGLIAVLVAVVVFRMQTSAALFADGLSTAAVKTALYGPFHLHCEGLIVGLLMSFLRNRSSATGALPSLVRGGFAGKSFAVMMSLAVTGLALRQLNGVLFPFLALAMIYGGLVWWLLDDQSVLSAPFRWKGWHMIARLSFGMYLNHLVWPHIGPELVQGATAALGSNAGALLVASVGAVAVSVLVATATYLTVEYPSLRLRSRLMSRKRDAAPGPVVQPLAAN